MTYGTFLSRRTLLTAAGAAGLAVALPAPAALAATAAPNLAALPPVSPDRRAFAADEQLYAPYLVSLAGMVGDIRTGSPNSGFLGGGWWRKPSEPYNARVQEHVYTLAWFLTTSRSWNPYRGNAELLAGLDAALGHYLGLQHADGSWPEYSPDEHSLAATGFALGYLSKTHVLLKNAQLLPARRTQIARATRAAMIWLLNPANGRVWQTPISFANQVAAGLAGSALALRTNPDAALRTQLNNAFARIAQHGQGPAGFFYEKGGTDMNYNFEVMLPELADAWRQSNNAHLVTMARKYTGWLGYNLLREPDGSGWFSNVAPSTRTSALAYDNTRPDPERTALNAQFVPEVPALGAFTSAREDLSAARAAWADDAAPVAGLTKQDTSPRILAHALYGERYPTRQAKADAVRALPYLASKNFTERRTDRGQDFLYIRRPDVYLGAYLGDRATTMARTGLSFLWHPVAGTVIQTLNDNDHGVWATVLPGQAPDSDGPQAGQFLGGSPYAFRFATPSGSVVTDVRVSDGLVRRSVRASSSATETVPLILKASDRVVFGNGTTVPWGGSASATATGLDLHRGPGVVRIRWGAARAASVAAASIRYLRDGSRRMHILKIPHSGSIEVSITLDY
ncbi:hypothetical protein PV689_11145 [Streptomyces sp. ATCC51928]|uniref:Uncharacterized protein n=1 Tax=Streptomyces caviscabies TaxID=90079 RepID=A0ABW2MBN0_9ACTN|nr:MULTISPECIES: hypothetical protein [unclassified Streptomyces]MDX3502471.1 hypothetical protein [Streptomyces sp. ATCC51928]MDX5522502.1 hypothetical protein [Streptomyces sp. DE06-01C]